MATASSMQNCCCSGRGCSCCKRLVLWLWRLLWWLLWWRLWLKMLTLLLLLLLLSWS
jgi:hypothetical protein